MPHKHGTEDQLSTEMILYVEFICGLFVTEFVHWSVEFWSETGIMLAPVAANQQLSKYRGKSQSHCSKIFDLAEEISKSN